MRIVITGGKGMLGRTLQSVLSEHRLIIADVPEWDVTDAADFDGRLKASHADAVIHCAAMTAVDACESEPDLAYRLNAVGSLNVAAACHRNNVRLIAISTDYVFDGALDRPYHEFDLAGNAHTVYGASKYAGEELIRHHCPDHLICRVSWLYGPGGPSFVHTMMSLADKAPPVIKVVDDQRGNPTSAFAVARHLALLLARPELAGTFHLTCEGEATWFEFAREIFRLAGRRQDIQPCSTSDFPRPAPRPGNSRLENRMLRLHGLPPMPDWREELKDFMHHEFP